MKDHLQVCQARLGSRITWGIPGILYGCPQAWLFLRVIISNGWLSQFLIGSTHSRFKSQYPKLLW